VTLTTRRRRPLNRGIPHLRDTRLVVVATEGERTEKYYFSIFERRSSRVQVRVLETRQGESAPRHVLARLRRYAREYELGSDDVLCLVIDEDRWPGDQLGEVAAQALQRGYELAVSCPCFEVWLYLHHADPTPSMATMNSRQVQDELRRVLGGQDGAHVQLEEFERRVSDAVRRARDLDRHPTERWPRRPGTRVYRVIDRIEEILRGS
jgi:hypothetical protein